MKIFTLRDKKVFLLLSLLLLIGFKSIAQTTISTTSSFTNDTTFSTVTFNFQNTNTYPVIITGVEGVVNNYGVNTVELWYKTSAINGAPGNIITTNGWTLGGTTTINGISNTTTTTTQPFLNGQNITVPAGSTYGIAIVVHNSSIGVQRIGTTSGTVTVSAGGCNIITGTNIGYAALSPPPNAPVITAAGWIGKLTFINGTNCTGTPAVPTISGPANICAYRLFALSATGYTIAPGISYQWQYYNTTNSTWTNVVGATSPTFINSLGIGAATQYRLRTTCSSSSAESFSNTLTVGIGTALPAGTYTINNNAPSSPSNFISFSAAAAAMICGISGPVVLNVDPASGPYTEMATFNDIPGTSPVNTIKLHGNGAILQYANDINDLTILKLDGTKHMSVDSLTIRSLDQNYAYGIMLTDSAAYDSITHCFVDLRSIAVNASSTAGISLSSNNISSGYYKATNCYVGYNHVLGSNEPGGPFYGIIDGFNYTWNTYQGNGNVIAHNEVENFTYFGIIADGNSGTKILYNDIHRKNKVNADNQYFVGIRNWGGYWNDTFQVQTTTEIIGNRIHDPGVNSNNNYNHFIGIQYDSWNSSINNQQGEKVIIANNAIYNVDNADGAVYGVWLGIGDNLNSTIGDTILLYHNTIDFSLSSSNSSNMYGIRVEDYYYNNPNSIDLVSIENNIITITGGTTGTKYGVYYQDIGTSSSYVLQASRNNIYVNSSQLGPQYYAFFGGTDYSSLAAFQAAYPALEVGSISVNPQYTAPLTGDFTPTNLALMGNGVNLQSIVPADILGRPRSTAPTPGAFEIGTDAGISALAAPLGTYCSSTKLVKVVLQNAGLNVINNVEIHWSLNGVIQPMVNYTGALAAQSTTVVTLGNGLFLPNTPVEIKAWTSMPNGQNDAFNYNDTLVITTQSSTSIPVNLGIDDTICTGNTITLDAGYGGTGTTYVWDNNATSQTRTLSVAGTYYVKVTALDGCIGVDTFNLDLYPLPVVDLGPFREICLGETTTFDAGHPGSTYLWDDGSTGQTRTVDTAGYYEVQVTDGNGCTGIGNAEVGMKDIPKADGINATHADSGRYTFYPLNPLYTITYTWNFGDGSPEVTGYFVQHDYTAKGIYTVTLHLEGECTGLIVDISRTVDVFSVPNGGGTGINNPVADGDFILFPNPAKKQVVIENKSQAKMQRLKVFNVLGQLIMDKPADSTTSHKLDISAIADGIYNLRIETDKGYIVRKFEVLH